jgi:hypothetical protein
MTLISKSNPASQLTPIAVQFVMSTGGEDGLTLGHMEFSCVGSTSSTQ